MRALRHFYQGFFLVLFFALLFLAAQGRLKGYPVTLFLDGSAFNGLAALLASGNVAHTMWIGFGVFILTLFLGRLFCGWICPLGTIFQITSRLARSRLARKQIEQNRYVAAQSVKYTLLVALLLCAWLGVLQAGLFDPIALLTRTSAVFLAPAAGSGWSAIAHHAPTRVFPAGPLIAGAFVALLLLNLYRPRFWCRYLCPLGALLGVAARFAPAGVIRDAVKCTKCGLCNRNCPGACSPDTTTRVAECFVCWNCIAECPEGALSWQWFGGKEKANRELDVSRRQFFGAAAGGLAASLSLRLGGATHGRGFEKRIRPPGALAEPEFLARCLKCGECMKVCPTNVLQPALAEAGAEGLWTPILDMRHGYCELNCTLCGQVCPSGALRRLTIAEKTGVPEGQPVKLGTAFVDRNRCIPWSLGRNCLVCQEVCPVSPKAITDTRAEVARDGRVVEVRRPQVDPAKCIGCGLCQHECPVTDLPAIRVTSVGESRAPGGSFFL